ncbi:MAG: glycosyltransferase family 1 protein [Deltaproteobacteria bacterium]
MKILFNAFSLVYPISGVGQYTLQLAKALENLLGQGSVLWFGKKILKDFRGGSDHQASFLTDPFRYALKNNLRKMPGFTTMVHLWRDRRFQLYIRQIRPSLYHETKYAPFHFDCGPTILTIYDLSFVRHPEWHPPDRVKHFEKYCLRKLPQVDTIITISEFSRKEIINLLNVRPEKIYVTPLGVDRAFTPGTQQIRELPDRYILFLGNLEPRKNLPVLVTAYTSLPEKLQERYPLVIAGAKGWHNHELNKTLLSLQKKERIIMTGYLPQETLPNLYRRASLFVYPSLYEGFGLPVVEAMASGVPVLTSNTTSLPEVVGDAGLLVDPYDVNDLREGMLKLLEDEKERNEMSEKGLERAKLFSWEKCARGTLSVYERTLTGKGRLTQ